MIRALRTEVTVGLVALIVAGCGGGNGTSSDGPDTDAPMVTYTTPGNGAKGVGTNARLTVTFSEPMNDASLASAIGLAEEASGSPIPAQSIEYDPLNKIATLIPQGPLDANRAYRASVSTAAKDISGNAMASTYTWTFVTSDGADLTAPAVSSVSPADVSTGVATSTTIAFSFSEPMNVATVTNAFALGTGTALVSGRLTYVGQAAVFEPDADLAPHTNYVARLRNTATDLAGNALAQDAIWTFTTGAVADTTPPAVVSVAPAPNTIKVARDLAFVVTFDEPIFPFVYGNVAGKVVEVSIDYATNTVTMRTTSQLDANTSYTASIAVGDLSGNRMPSPYAWQFVTGP